MGYISEECIEQIKARADIVDVVSSFTDVRKKGKDFWCCCPFHREKTASCKLDQERQGFYCFGCKEHGNIVTFVMKIMNTDYPGALRWLADKVGVTIVEETHGMRPGEAERLRALRDKRARLLEDAANWYHSLLNAPEASNARNYLASRGLDAASVEHFKLGFSYDSWDAILRWGATFGYDVEDLKATGMLSENESTGRVYDRFRGRLMFPIWNENGKVVGFSARVLQKDDNVAKYLNTPETDFFQKGQLLYAMNFARPRMKEFGYALVCEGQLDVISCHRAGLDNAIAAQGTAFTEYHAKKLKKSVENVVLSFDADTAGYKAAERTIGLLHAAGLGVSVVTLPQGEDPDSIFRKGGAEALRQMMSVTEPAIPYIFRVACLQADINRPEDKSRIIDRVIQVIRPIQDKVVRIAHLQWLAKNTNTPEQAVFEHFDNGVSLMAPRVQAPVRKNPAPVFTPPSAPNEQCWGLLLDLIMHVEAFAHEFAFMEELLTVVPNSPVGQAINHVLILMEQEEWNTAIEAISEMEISKDILVGKAIYASECTELGGSDSEIGRRAFNDCILKIRRQYISVLIQKKQIEMDAANDAERKRILFEEINALVREKAQLRMTRN